LTIFFDLKEKIRNEISLILFSFFVSMSNEAKAVNFILLLCTTASLVVTVLSLMSTDFIHWTSLMGRVEFGFFKSCFSSSLFSLCENFPPQDGSCKIDAGIEVHNLTLIVA
jgi:hypothetical protein